MDAASIKAFVAKIPGFYELTNRAKIVYAAYHLTSVGQSPFSARDLETFFNLLTIPVSRISQILSEESKARGGKGKFLKTKGRGYQLNGSIYAKIENAVEKIPELKLLDDELTMLISSVTETDERLMLEEAMKCYRVGSNRAVIILIWIAAMYHLEKYTLRNYLAAFNSAASRHPDKRVSKLIVRKIDDFTELKETDLITLLRSSGVISNSIRNMLDGRLRERNTAAHPSSVSISGPKAVEFSYDIVSNVILKYK